MVGEERAERVQEVIPERRPSGRRRSEGEREGRLEGRRRRGKREEGELGKEQECRGMR